MKRVGILTSGGDCQGLNAAIRGVAKSLYEYDDDESLEIYGIRDGYTGLINGDYHIMRKEDFSGILTIGGTILGTSRQPFKLMRQSTENNIDKVSAMKNNYQKMKLDCLVILGGNGTHKSANMLSGEGLNVVTLPKTIDNDLWGTDITFGFQSAVNIATNVIDCIHTTATSHGRVFIIELMGHKAGWLTLHAGIAGGADIILIPEIPYTIESIVKTLNSRTKEGKNFSIIAVAEGAISRQLSLLSKSEQKKLKENSSYPSISYEIASKIEEFTSCEVRVTVPGHFQRGGSPCPYDRVLATRLGAAAAKLIIKKEYGKMVAIKNNELVTVDLKDVAGKLKTVPVDASIIQSARDIGISFGN